MNFAYAKFSTADPAYAFLKWTRFLGVLLLALLLLPRCKSRATAACASVLGEATPELT